MQILITLLGGLLAAGWAGIAAEYFAGARRGRTLREVAPNGETPSLTVVVPACNEADKLPRAFRSLLAQRYPGPYEIVAVDDRSSDGTGEMLDFLAREAPPGAAVTVLHLTMLPAGWLGKNHALWQGAQRASGTYLLFTDADVVFAPDALARAVRLATRDQLDHLVLLLRLDLRGFWENVFGLCFSYLFVLRFRPWHVGDPQRSEYLGVGSFNLVRRSAYEAVGTHRAIALEVADDMELGRQIKRAGFRSAVAGAADFLSVRWQEGLRGLMGGLVKNAYAGLDYSPGVAAASVGLLLATVVWPVAGLFLSRSKVGKAAYAVALAGIISTGGAHARGARIPPAYALTLPFSTLLLIGVMLRSVYLTEKNGGITWRNTFYPLDMLRRRALPPPPPLQG